MAMQPSPLDLARRLSLTVYSELFRTRVFTVAAALAFFFLLGFIPLLIVLASLLAYLPVPNLFGQLMSAPIFIDACVSGHKTFGGLTVYDIGEWYVRGEGDDVSVLRFYHPTLGQAAMPGSIVLPPVRKQLTIMRFASAKR